MSGERTVEQPGNGDWTRKNLWQQTMNNVPLEFFFMGTIIMMSLPEGGIYSMNICSSIIEVRRTDQRNGNYYDLTG